MRNAKSVKKIFCHTREYVTTNNLSTPICLDMIFYVRTRNCNITSHHALPQNIANMIFVNLLLQKYDEMCLVFTATRKIIFHHTVSHQGMSTSHWASFSMHLRDQHGVEGGSKAKVRCNWTKCGTVVNKENLVRHVMEQHLLYRFLCEECGGNFSRRHTLNSHVQKKHQTHMGGCHQRRTGHRKG